MRITKILKFTKLQKLIFFIHYIKTALKLEMQFNQNYEIRILVALKDELFDTIFSCLMQPFLGFRLSVAPILTLRVISTLGRSFLESFVYNSCSKFWF